MSLTTKQIDELRAYAKNRKGELAKLINDAADTIEVLSAKVREQKWIPCSDTVDIPDHEIMACDKYGEIMFGYLAYEDEQWICGSDGCEMVDPIAWREKPEPYRKEGENE